VPSDGKWTQRFNQHKHFAVWAPFGGPAHRCKRIEWLQPERANPDALSRVVQGIIQGIMAGISFIGAGVILRDAKAGTVEGLTTAATV
jgi:hypothetical protein